MADVFQKDYSRVYDILYSHKDYVREAAAVQSLLVDFSDGPLKRVMSIGAGTLNHEQHLAGNGYVIDGIDYSDEMVKIAQQKIIDLGMVDISIVRGDMKKLIVTEEKYDAAIALFNVVSYCLDDTELLQMMRGVSSNLREGGILIFDCWNGSVTRKDPPTDKSVNFVHNDIKVYRYTHITPFLEKGHLTIEFDLLCVKDKQVVNEIKEIHDVSFWDVAQYKKIFEQCGMEIVGVSQFPDVTNSDISCSWSMAIVARKCMKI